jgi:hypothetical protein
MVLPVPHPGQVIRYAYLWWNEARRGREDGTKDRPCSIVLTRITTAGRTVAYVLPITQTPGWIPSGPGSSPLNSINSLGPALT